MASEPNVEPRTRRGPFQFLFKSVVGCSSLILGAGVMLILLLPTIASAVGGGFVEGYLDRQVSGSFEIGSLDLAWSSRQKLSGLRLFDPEGVEVGRADVVVPGLLTLLRGRGKRLGHVEVECTLALVSDDQGLSNLERSLAARESAPSAPSGSQRERPAQAAYQVTLDLLCRQLSWSDATTRASGTPFVLRDVRGHLQLTPDAPLELRLDGTVDAGRPGVLRAEARVDEPFDFTNLERPSGFHLDCEVAGIPTALVDSLSGQGGLLAGILGEEFRLRAQGDGTNAQGNLELTFESAHARLDLAGRVENGAFRRTADPAQAGQPELALDLRQDWVRSLLADALPPGVSLLPVGEGQRIEVRLLDWVLPVGALLEPLEAGGDPLQALVRGAELQLDLTAGNWVWSDGARAFELAGVGAGLNVLPANDAGSKPFEVTLRAGTAGPSPARLEARVSGGDLNMLASYVPGGPLIPVALEGRLTGVETALISEWSGATLDLSALGPTLSVDLEAHVKQPAGSPLEANFDAALTTGAGVSRLVCGLNLREGWTVFDSEAWPELEANLALEGTGPIVALMSGAPLLSEWLGERVQAKLVHTGRAPSAGELSIECHAGGFDLTASARLEDLVLHIERGHSLRLDARPAGRVIDSSTLAALPVGASLTFADGPLELTCNELRVGLAAWLAAADQPVSPDALTDLVRELQGSFAAKVAGVTYRHPQAGADSVPAELRNLQFRVRFATGEPDHVEIVGEVAATPPGSIDVSVDVEHSEALVAGPDADPAAAYEISGTMSRMPTSLFDAIAAQDGLLIDVLGPELTAKVSGAWPGTDARPLVADLTSSKASLQLESRLEDGVLVAGDDGEIHASTGLTPLFSRRIVGNLVPMMVQMTKPEGAGPAAIHAKRFRLPLDGDMAKLSGEIVIDLGQVDYQLLPGIDKLVKEAVGKQGGAGMTKLEPFTLHIQEGVVRAPALPLDFNGRAVVLEGSYSLVERRYNLTTNLPLKALGSGLGSKLDGVRDYIDPEMSVPIEIKGNFGAPKIKVRADFMKKVVEKAAENALKKGLGDLFKKKQ
jgi:hypothetical protein